MILAWTENTTPWPEPLGAEILGSLPPILAAAAGRYRRWQDRQNTLLGKLLLRALLERAGFDTTLANIQFSPRGRPSLPGAGDFSIAHSGSRVICAWAPRGRIGVDIEAYQPGLWIEPLASVLSAGELAELARAPDPDRALLRSWTSKEAVAKAAGTGIADVELPDSAGACPGRPIRFGNRDWHVRSFEEGGYTVSWAAEDATALASAMRVRMRLGGDGALRPAGIAEPLP